MTEATITAYIPAVGHSIKNGYRYSRDAAYLSERDAILYSKVWIGLGHSGNTRVIDIKVPVELVPIFDKFRDTIFTPVDILSDRDNSVVIPVWSITTGANDLRIVQDQFVGGMTRKLNLCLPADSRGCAALRLSGITYEK